jgi:hypothetical protein
MTAVDLWDGQVSILTKMHVREKGRDASVMSALVELAGKCTGVGALRPFPFW